MKTKEANKQIFRSPNPPFRPRVHSDSSKCLATHRRVAPEGRVLASTVSELSGCAGWGWGKAIRTSDSAVIQQRCLDQLPAVPERLLFYKLSWDREH